MYVLRSSGVRSIVFEILNKQFKIVCFYLPAKNAIMEALVGRERQDRLSRPNGLEALLDIGSLPFISRFLMHK